MTEQDLIALYGFMKQVAIMEVRLDKAEKELAAQKELAALKSPKVPLESK